MEEGTVWKEVSLQLALMYGEKEEKEESIPFNGEQHKQIEVGITAFSWVSGSLVQLWWRGFQVAKSADKVVTSPRGVRLPQPKVVWNVVEPHLDSPGAALLGPTLACVGPELCEPGCPTNSMPLSPHL